MPYLAARMCRIGPLCQEFRRRFAPTRRRRAVALLPRALRRPRANDRLPGFLRLRAPFRAAALRAAALRFRVAAPLRPAALRFAALIGFRFRPTARRRRTGALRLRFTLATVDPPRFGFFRLAVVELRDKTARRFVGFLRRRPAGFTYIIGIYIVPPDIARAFAR